MSMLKILLLVMCISSLNAQKKSLNHLKFNSKIISYKIIKTQQKDPHIVKANFIFTNIAASPINILDVKPSCSCTTPSFSKEPILPGKKGFIILQTTTQQLKNNGLVYAVVKTSSNIDTYIKLVLNY